MVIAPFSGPRRFCTYKISYHSFLQKTRNHPRIFRHFLPKRENRPHNWGRSPLNEKGCALAAFFRKNVFLGHASEKTPRPALFPQKTGEAGPQAGASHRLLCSHGPSGPRRECGVGRREPVGQATGADPIKRVPRKIKILRGIKTQRSGFATVETSKSRPLPGTAFAYPSLTEQRSASW